MAAREGWLKAIEDARTRRGIDNPLDVGLEIADAEGLLNGFDAADLADLCGISRFGAATDVDAAAPRVVDLRGEPRCERSWKRDGTVRPRAGGDHLSDRDAAAVGAA
jgi:isoleucyl-tRNA synthetase